MSAPEPTPEPIRYEGELPPHLRRWVAGLLRGGVILAAALLGIGLVLWAVEGAPVPSQVGLAPGTFTLFAGLGAGSGFGFMAVGLLVLVLTPLARVFVSLTLFARARDRPFVLLTAFVLVVLLISVVLGLFGAPV